MTIRDSDFFVVWKGDQSIGPNDDPAKAKPRHLVSITLGRWKEEVQRLNGVVPPDHTGHNQRDFLLFHMSPPWCTTLNHYDPPAAPLQDRVYQPRHYDDLLLMEMQHRPVVYGGTPRRALTIERPTRVVWVTAGTLQARISVEYHGEMTKQPHYWEGDHPWAAALAPMFVDYFLVGRGSDLARKVTFRELYDYAADGLPHRS